MICGRCENVFSGSRCACGWSPTPQKAESKGDYSHSPLRRCDWWTEGRQCRMGAFLSLSGWCAWHRTWEPIMSRSLDEFCTFQEWVQQFRPGGNYGDNPGPWWCDTALLWNAVRGGDALPPLTDAWRTELQLRHSAAMRERDQLPPMGRYPGLRLTGLPGPPWPAPKLVVIEGGGVRA